VKLVEEQKGNKKMNKLELIENLKEHYKTILEASRIRRGAFKGKSPEEIEAIVNQENARLKFREKKLERGLANPRTNMVLSQRLGMKFGSTSNEKLKNLNPFVANPKLSIFKNKNSMDLSIRRREGKTPIRLDDYGTFAYGQGKITAAKGFGETGKRRPRK
jgi:hypothetical protein